MSTASEHRPLRVRVRARLVWLAKRLALLFGSILVTLLLLELVARIFDPVPPPFEVRPGLYALTLPLVNGRADARWFTKPTSPGPPLPKEKAEGELRVVVFGESSAEGVPWGQLGSPAAFLQEGLATRLPGRRVTVINAGKASSFLMDSFYYLIAAQEYDPDYVVFYQGTNDRFDLDREMCEVTTHPGLHSVWRWIVAHSHVAWLVRAYGPEIYLSLTSSPEEQKFRSGEPQPDLCDGGDAFEAWTDILLSTAQKDGARVVVAGFVRADLRGEELVERDRPSETARKLLWCPLQPDCSPAAILKEGRSLVDWLSELGGDSDDSVAGRNLAWRRTVARRGGMFVDFTTMAREMPEPDAWLPPLFVDGTHLSVAGYAVLGEQMALAVIASEAGESVPAEGFWRLDESLVDYYEVVRQRTLDVVPQCDLLLVHADSYFASDWWPLAGYMWRDALTICPPERVAPNLDRYREAVAKHLEAVQD